MRINSMVGNYSNYSTNINKMNLKEKNISKENQLDTMKNNISSNKIRSKSPYPSGMTPIDKGTAIETTINVDRSTIFSIINYAVSDTANNGFEEMGMDDNKRWVVINGQRFECELTPEEKERIRKAKEGNTLLSYLAESEDKKYENKEKLEISFKDGQVELSDNSNNPKIQNLLNNDKVMEMLSVIGSYSPIKLQF